MGLPLGCLTRPGTERVLGFFLMKRLACTCLRANRSPRASWVCGVGYQQCSISGRNNAVHGKIEAYNLAAGRASQDEGCLGVLDGLGRPLLESALGASVPGFSVQAGVRFQNLSILDPRRHGLHLAQHFVYFGGMVKGKLAIGGFPVASCDALAIARRSRKSRQGLIDKKS